MLFRSDEQLERLAAAALVVAEQRDDAPEDDEEDESAATWLEASSARLLAGEGFAPVSRTIAAVDLTARGRAAVAARALLHSEMEVAHASSI